MRSSLYAMKIPPPLSFLSFLTAWWGGGKISEFVKVPFRCDSVRNMSGCSTVKREWSCFWLIYSLSSYFWVFPFSCVIHLLHCYWLASERSHQKNPQIGCLIWFWKDFHPWYWYYPDTPVSLCWIYWWTRTNWPFMFGWGVIPCHSGNDNDNDIQFEQCSSNLCNFGMPA